MPEYSMNIALGGRHFAKVIIGADSDIEAESKYHVIRLRMGHEYKCSLTRWNTVGTTMVEGALRGGE